MGSSQSKYKKLNNSLIFSHIIVTDVISSSDKIILEINDDNLIKFKDKYFPSCESVELEIPLSHYNKNLMTWKEFVYINKDYININEPDDKLVYVYHFLGSYKSIFYKVKDKILYIRNFN